MEMADGNRCKYIKGAKPIAFQRGSEAIRMNFLHRANYRAKARYSGSADVSPASERSIALSTLKMRRERFRKSMSHTAVTDSITDRTLIPRLFQCRRDAWGPRGTEARQFHFPHLLNDHNAYLRGLQLQLYLQA